MVMGFDPCIYNMFKKRNFVSVRRTGYRPCNYDWFGQEYFAKMVSNIWEAIIGRQ